MLGGYYQSGLSLCGQRLSLQRMWVHHLVNGLWVGKRRIESSLLLRVAVGKNLKKVEEY